MRMKRENQAVVYSKLEWMQHDIEEENKEYSKKGLKGRQSDCCETEWVEGKEVNRSHLYRNGLSGDGVWRK